MIHTYKVKLHSDELCQDDYIEVNAANKHTAMICGEEEYNRPSFMAVDATAVFSNSEVIH